MTGIAYSSSLSVSFSTNLLYYVSGTAVPVTSLTITNLPSASLTSYTFTFILATTSASNYITASSVNVNGTYYYVYGNLVINTPLGYIIQQFTILNTSNTNIPSYAAITSANAF